MKPLHLTGSETVGALADLMSISPVEVVSVGFKELGLLLTVSDVPERSRVRELVRHFGFAAIWQDRSNP